MSSHHARTIARCCSPILFAVLGAGCDQGGRSPASGTHAPASASAAASASPLATPNRPSPIEPLTRRTYTLAADGRWVHAGTTAGVVSWDVSDPASPREVASLTLAGSVAHVALVDSASHILAVSTGPTGIAVVDASRVAARKLVLRGEHPWAVESRGGCHAAWKFAPVGAHRGLVACGGGGVGDAELLKEGGVRVHRTVDVGGYVRDLEVLDGASGAKNGGPAKKLVAVAAGSGGLAILEFGRLPAPTTVARVELPGEARALDAQDGMAYVAAGAAGLQIVNLKDPLRAALVGAFRPDVTDMARGVVVHDKTAYVCFGESGLVIVDVRDPAAPARLGGYDPERSLNRALLHDGLLLTANDDNGLLLLDVKNPAKPVVVYASRKTAR